MPKQNMGRRGDWEWNAVQNQFAFPSSNIDRLILLQGIITIENVMWELNIEIPAQVVF